MAIQTLTFPAIEVQQSEGRRLYTFAVDGKQLSRFAAISRIARPQGEHIEGYQRPEVLSHIKEIRKYIESESPMIPNAIVLAFDQRVTFVSEERSENSYSRAGVIHIPIADGWKDEEKPAWVVDGQQRMAAIREASVARFPICVTGFVAHDVQQQREQFILVNSTKPLAKGLIYELLPTTQMVLPEMLAKRRFPSTLLNNLNHDPESPFYSKIKTATNPGGAIQDNSILKMIEHSLSDGALYRFRDRDGGGDSEAMLKLLKDYWSTVAVVFKDAWDLLHSREHGGKPRLLGTVGRGERKEQAGADHLHIILGTIVVALQHVQLKQGGLDVMAEKSQIRGLLGRARLCCSEA